MRGAYARNSQALWFATVVLGLFVRRKAVRFFHRSSLQDLNFEALKEGDAVEFEVEDGPKGPRAVVVKSSSE